MSERVAVYVRVSTTEQAERQTIEAQVIACRDYCEAKGYQIMAEFLDDGVSGTVPFEERPEGRRLLEAGKDELFSHVIILCPDRLGRDVTEALLAMRAFKRLRLTVEFVVQSFDDTPEGTFQFQVLAAVAQLERGLITRRTMAGRRQHVRNGDLYMAPVSPYGYLRDGKGLKPHPEQAEVVKDIFRWTVEENLGIQAIARRLNKVGIPPPDGATRRSQHGWHSTTIYKFLAASRYAGRGRYANEVMTCPPLVSEELFEAAQEAMRRRHRQNRGATKYVYLLQHLARCRACGSACTVGRASGGRPTYRCGHARRYGAATHNGRSSWPASLVEPPVQRWVLSVLDDPDAALARAEFSWHREDEAQRERAERRRKLEERIRGLDNEELRVLEWARKGHIDEAAMLQQLDQVRAERAKLTRQFQELQANDGAVRVEVNRQLVKAAINLMRRPEWRDRSHELDELLVSHGHSFEFILDGRLLQWQGLIRSFISTVWLEENGDVTVEGILALEVGNTDFPPS